MQYALNKRDFIELLHRYQSNSASIFSLGFYYYFILYGKKERIPSIANQRKLSCDKLWLSEWKKDARRA
ncbi:hypothetical protein CBG25_00545 [Arsenophonus sp. ENCA]|nr:hypothetical protein CBG25_00545 [Arsenophonus sp. ENCA]